MLVTTASMIDSPVSTPKDSARAKAGSLSSMSSLVIVSRMNGNEEEAIMKRLLDWVVEMNDSSRSKNSQRQVEIRLVDHVFVDD